MFVSMQVVVDGNVANWQGQVFRNGNEAIEADIFYPMLSRVRFDSPQADRALTAQTSGIELKPLGNPNYSKSYLGNLSAPVFLAEGGGRGLAFVDDNRADYAPRTGRRGATRAGHWEHISDPGRPRHRRRAGAVPGHPLHACVPARRVYGGEAEYNSAEPAAGKNNPLPSANSARPWTWAP